MEKTIAKNEIIEQQDKLYQAIVGGNIETLGKLLHNDLLFIAPSDEMITEEIDLDTYRDAALKIDIITPNIKTLISLMM